MIGSRHASAKSGGAMSLLSDLHDNETKLLRQLREARREQR